MRSSAAKTRRALVADQMLIGNRERNGERGGAHLTMSNSVRNHFNCQPFGAANGLVARPTVTKDAGQFDGFGNPASVIFALQINGQLHA